jgi:hypothetical protein
MFMESRALPVRKADNFIAICEPTVLWDVEATHRPPFNRRKIPGTNFC